MSVELNENQVSQIEARLQELGVNYQPLQQELLDHICCMIEVRIEEGNSFEAAIQAVFEVSPGQRASFEKDELKELQKKSIYYFTHQKSQRMKKMAFVVLGLLLLLACTWVFQKEDMEGLQPPGPEEMLKLADHVDTIVKDVHQGFVVQQVATNESDPPSIKPLSGNYKVMSGYGQRMHPIYKVKKLHTGVDFKAPKGTPVLATSDGKIIKVVRQKTGSGKFIIIKHDDIYQTKYSHLDKILVKKGQEIKKGEVIGLVGSSGTSVGPHLHYEVIKNGKQVDPEDYLNL